MFVKTDKSYLQNFQKFLIFPSLGGLFLKYSFVHIQSPNQYFNLSVSGPTQTKPQLFGDHHLFGVWI